MANILILHPYLFLNNSKNMLHFICLLTLLIFIKIEIFESEKEFISKLEINFN